MSQEEFIQQFVLKHLDQSNDLLTPEQEIEYRSYKIEKLIKKAQLYYNKISQEIQ